MNLFRLILIFCLSLGIGLHSANAEGMSENEVPEPKEIVNTFSVPNHSLGIQKATAKKTAGFSTHILKTLKTDSRSAPKQQVKRHLLVMQFLL